MFCPKCKIEVGNIEFCENCGGATVESNKDVIKDHKKGTNLNEKAKFIACGVTGAVIVIIGVIAFNIMNRPTADVNKTLEKIYGDTVTSIVSEENPEEAKIELSATATDEMKSIAEQFINLYYKNVPKEDYEAYFTPDSEVYYNTNPAIDNFEFKREVDKNEEIKGVEITGNKLTDNTHASLNITVNIVRDGYDFSKLEPQLIRVEDYQKFIFTFESVNGKWLISTVKKPLI